MSVDKIVFGEISVGQKTRQHFFKLAAKKFLFDIFGNSDD